MPLQRDLCLLLRLNYGSFPPVRQTCKPLYNAGTKKEILTMFMPCTRFSPAHLYHVLYKTHTEPLEIAYITISGFYAHMHQILPQIWKSLSCWWETLLLGQRWSGTSIILKANHNSSSLTWMYSKAVLTVLIQDVSQKKKNWKKTKLNHRNGFVHCKSFGSMYSVFLLKDLYLFQPDLRCNYWRSRFVYKE